MEKSSDRSGRKIAVIAGAGPAGLTAAYRLLETTDFIPVILEETDRIGGISQTVEYHGNRIDIGGHRFFSKNPEVVALWNALLPNQGAPACDDILLGREAAVTPGNPDPEREDRVMLTRNRISRIFYLGAFFDYPISLKLSTLLNMGIGRTFLAGCSYLGSCLFKRREKSLEDFYINRFGKTLYRMFFEDYTEKLWGIHPSRISPDWGAQRVKGLSLSKAVLNMLAKPFRREGSRVETSLIESFAYPKRGPGQYWETMAERITAAGGRIELGARVCGFSVADGVVRSVRFERDGRIDELACDCFFSSMPIRDLIRALPGVPAEVSRVAEGLPYRDFITVGLLVDKLKLRNRTKIKTVNGLVPDCWIYIQERNVRIGRLQIFNNWSPYMVRDWRNTVWLGLEYFCTEGDDMWKMPEREFIDFAIDELVRIGIIDRDSVRDAVRIPIRKAYPAYFGTYPEFCKVRSFLDTISNLYCIGRNGQHRYNNMDHSMLCAMEAVRALRGEIPKSAVWEVNAEQEYHEQKSAN
ncbi:MAG: NAD(P)/FAD-dependent oxidoreductase [Lentisphaeria bacterium]|nr:NAD(P)/FAD-dependent oxidoreductase [Lentisphaeria bacterium]